MGLPLATNAEKSSLPETKEDTATGSANAQTQTEGTQTKGTQTLGIQAQGTQAKTQQELDAERRYEEAIEEEYAKREGGA